MTSTHQHSIPPESLRQTARRWRLWLWQTSLTGEPSPGLSFNSAVLGDPALATLMSGDAYKSLMTAAAGFLSADDSRQMAARMMENCFPSACRCRRHSAMEHDFVSFQKHAIYRSLNFSDESVTKHMLTLFRRTPELRLLECVECGDVWLRGLDQLEGIQHLALVEPDDLTLIENQGVWPATLDRFEDAWVLAFGTLGLNSPDIHNWQMLHNTQKAFARFSKPST